MKAILVINMPEDFDYRRCSIGGDGNIYYERKSEQRTSIIGNIKNLKPLPQKRNTSKLQSFGNFQIVWTDRTIYQNEGWDACIDEIMGETEEKEK